MGQIVPDSIEAYLASLNRQRDPLLDEIARQGSALPLIDPEVGALLEVLARAVAAQRILEIGTALGYSGIWLARALPIDGQLFTIEIDPQRATAARANFKRAGMETRVNVLVGDASRLVHKVAGPFDLIFNDGSKLQYEPLLDRLVNLLRLGGLLVTDNVLWGGEVVPGFTGAQKRAADHADAIAAFNRRLADDTRMRTSILPIRDGVALSVRVA